MKKPIVDKIVVGLMLVIFGFFFLYPFWIGFWAALKSLKVMNATAVWAPTLQLTLQPARDALVQLWRPAWHSIVIAGLVSVLAIAGGATGGYVLISGKFRMKGVILALVLFGIYIPGATKLLPTLKLVQWLGLYDTDFAVGLSVGAMMLPISTILFRQFYRQFPSSFFEAAVIAGGNHLDIFGRIVIPLSKIPTVTVAVLSLGTGWNVYLLPLVLTTGSPKDRPVGVLLSNLRAGAMQDGTFNMMLAAALLAALPPILLYIFAQKYITTGFRSLGGVEK